MWFLDFLQLFFLPVFHKPHLRQLVNKRQHSCLNHVYQPAGGTVYQSETNHSPLPLFGINSFPKGTFLEFR